MAEGLTGKQKLFVEHYLDCLNATEAARRTGYAESGIRVQAHRLLTNANVATAISEAMSERIMGANEAAMRLSEQARGSIGAFLATDDDGKPTGFSLSAERPLHQVKKVTTTDKGWSFEMYDAQSALVSVLKLHGKFVDRVAIEQEYQETLERLRAGLTPDEYAKVAAILIAGDSAA